MYPLNWYIHKAISKKYKTEKNTIYSLPFLPVPRSWVRLDFTLEGYFYSCILNKVLREFLPGTGLSVPATLFSGFTSWCKQITFYTNGSFDQKHLPKHTQRKSNFHGIVIANEIFLVITKISSPLCRKCPPPFQTHDTYIRIWAYFPVSPIDKKQNFLFHNIHCPKKLLQYNICVQIR